MQRLLDTNPEINQSDSQDSRVAPRLDRKTYCEQRGAAETGGVCDAGPWQLTGHVRNPV